jgi:hypothetical protein
LSLAQHTDPVRETDPRPTSAPPALIVLDAFSPDSIPLHLPKREAFAGYLSRLTAHGAGTWRFTGLRPPSRAPKASVLIGGATTGWTKPARTSGPERTWSCSPGIREISAI